MVDFSLLNKLPSKGGYTLSKVVEIAKNLGLETLKEDGSRKAKWEIGREISYLVRNHHKKSLETGTKFRWFWGGVLPTVVAPNGEPLYLLGQEQTGEWSIIGGGRDGSDGTPIVTAAREGYEESMGFLGDEWELITALMKPEVQQLLLHGKYALYMMPVEYDENLPDYFRRVYEYFKKCSVKSDHPKLECHIPSCPSGFFELTAVRWFGEQEILDSLAGNTGVGIPRLKDVTRKIFRALWGNIKKADKI